MRLSMGTKLGAVGAAKPFFVPPVSFATFLGIFRSDSTVVLHRWVLGGIDDGGGRRGMLRDRLLECGWGVWRRGFCDGCGSLFSLPPCAAHIAF